MVTRISKEQWAAGIIESICVPQGARVTGSSIHVGTETVKVRLDWRGAKELIKGSTSVEVPLDVFYSDTLSDWLKDHFAKPEEETVIIDLVKWE